MYPRLVGAPPNLVSKPPHRRLAAAFGLGVLAMGLGGIGLALILAGHATFHDFDPTTVVFPFTMAAVGVVVVVHVPRNPLGWLFLAASCVVGIEAVTGALAFRSLVLHDGSHDLGVWAEWVINWLGGLLFPSGLVAIMMLLVPTGRLPSRRWRWAVAASFAVTAILVLGLMFDPAKMKNATAVPAVGNPLGVRSLSFLVNSGLDTVIWCAALVVGLVAAGAPFLRYRRAGGEQRQQLKWIALPLAITTAAYAAIAFGPPGVSSAGDGAVGWIIAIVGYGVALPIAIGIAIVKYRLYSIDAAINRAVVYSVLAAFIAAVYLAVAVGFGSLIGSKSNVLLSLVGAAIVAVGFQPVRIRAHRFANRVVYGDRATPYEALARFAEQAAGTHAVDDALTQMARVVAEGTRAQTSCVWLRDGANAVPAAVWPPGSELPGPVSLADIESDGPNGSARFVPVGRGNEVLGALSVEMRPAEWLTPIEVGLLEHLAEQAGLFLKNAGLTAELQRTIADLEASRRRIAHAEDEARRRIERDLHDGAQQHIVALAFQLAKVERDLRNAGEETSGLASLRVHAQEALDSLRELAHGVYPPLLADRGLGSALQAHARRVDLDVIVDAKGLPRYPPEVEAAVYFCVLEAIQNAQKHSQARRVEIAFARECDGLAFHVRDDGVGFDPATSRAGVGLASMTDRIAAEGGTLLIDSHPGGGTTICGRLPTRERPGPAATPPSADEASPTSGDSLLSGRGNSNGHRRGQPSRPRRRPWPSVRR